MTIIIFIIILLILVMIHEAGHFMAAKISGVRVDEFAFGFPPKIFSKKHGETTYIINALPIGGYVKIHGQDGAGETDSRSFVNKNVWLKIFILSAGVLMNFLLAYLLIVISLQNSATFVVDENDPQYQILSKNNSLNIEKVMIVDVLAKSPAENIGLKTGQKIEEIFLNKENKAGKIISQQKIDWKNKNGDNVAQEISQSLNANFQDKNFANSITLIYQDKENLASSTLAGVYGLSENKIKVLGLSFVKVASFDLTFFQSLKFGIEKTNRFIYLSLIGFKDLFLNLFTKGELSKDISGPIGIIQMIDSSKSFGFDYLLNLTALLSISLAIFNILPFPALDGGRIIFVLIESLLSKKISEKWQIILNGSGFAILILLMVIVTVKDLWKFFS